MQALAWVALAACLAAVSTLMMLACVPVGAALRFFHQAVISRQSFAQVRRLGLRGFLWRSLTAAAHQAVRRQWKWPQRGWGLAAAIVLVPASGFILGGVLPFAIAVFFLSPAEVSGRPGDVLAEGAGLAGAVAAATATWVWVRGLAFVARPSAGRRSGRVEPLMLPPDLSQEIRDHLALNIYWRSRVKTACVFSAMYPWWFVLAVMAGTTGNGPSATGGSYQDVSAAASLGQFLIVLAPTLLPTLLACRPVERRLLSAKVCEELCLILSPPAQGGSSAGREFVGLVGDPLGNLRWRIGQAAVDLDDAAAQLDRTQVRGLPPHPVATLMRAASRSVRQYLGSERSLHEKLPDDVRELLSLTLALFGAHDDPAVYSRLAQQVSAFDADGNPAVEVTLKPPGRLARTTGQAFAGIPKVTLAITSITTLVAIALAALLAARHQMTITQLLQFLH